MTSIGETTYGDYPAIRMENEALSLVIIPELGGKIISLLNKANRFDCSFVNPFTGLVKQAYDAPYLVSDCGFGELLPSIAPDVYPDGPWKGIGLPDKGELWTQPYETEIADGRLSQRAGGVRFPYLYHREVSLVGNRIQLDFRIENTCNFDLKYQWSMQPHLRISGRMSIEAPIPSKFYVDWSRNYRFRTGELEYAWPVAATETDDSGDGGNEVDFSCIDIMNGDADKLFLSDLGKGEVALAYHDRKQRVKFSFDTAANPYCGLWINKAGWPLEKEQTRLVAVQPCNCMSDSFSVSDRKGAIGVVKAKSRNEWSVAITVEPL